MSDQTSTIGTEPVILTQGAITALQRIRQDENIPEDYCLRIGVKGGGCSGFSYVMAFDKLQDNDQVYEIGGLKVLMEKSHLLYLMGMEIDWIEGLENRGFSFANPNATDTCGCGTSFSA
jgi:iron-sulfur cluster assembly protein